MRLRLHDGRSLFDFSLSTKKIHFDIFIWMLKIPLVHSWIIEDDFAWTISKRNMNFLIYGPLHIYVVWMWRVRGQTHVDSQRKKIQEFNSMVRGHSPTASTCRSFCPFWDYGPLAIGWLNWPMSRSLLKLTIIARKTCSGPWKWTLGPCFTLSPYSYQLFFHPCFGPIFPFYTQCQNHLNDNPNQQPEMLNLSVESNPQSCHFENTPSSLIMVGNTQHLGRIPYITLLMKIMKHHLQQLCQTLNY